MLVEGRKGLERQLCCVVSAEVTSGEGNEAVFAAEDGCVEFSVEDISNDEASGEDGGEGKHVFDE